MFKYKLIGENDYIFDLVGNLSANREVEDLNEFLELDESVIQDFKVYKNIDKASDVIKKHIDNDSNIMIVVDADADGYTSATIIYQYIKLQNENVNVQYYIHDGKKHGIKGVTLNNKIDLIIIPDASTNEEEEHKRMYELGIEVVVLDHHEVECEEESKYAVVVNPQLDKVGNLSLSGAGIVYKTCKYLDELYNTDYADDFLDLVAVGNIADVMSMKNKETRYLVNLGLENINNQFLSELVEAQSYSMKNEVNPTTIGFYIAPLINAVTRIGTIEERTDMFKAFIEHKELVEYKPRGKDKVELVPFVSDFVRRCKNIKARQDRIKEKGLNSVLENTKINESDKVIVVKDVKLESGMGGIIATQIANKFMKPTLIMNYVKDEDAYMGSGRTYGNYTELKDKLNDSGLFNFAKGHGSAFGVSLNKDMIENIQDKLNELFSNVEFENIYEADFAVPLNSVNIGMIEDICELAPIWGKDLPEPLVVITDVKTNNVNIQVIGSKMDTVEIKRGNITYIAFKRKAEEIFDIKNAKELELIGKFKLNTYKGQKQHQFIIDNINIIK